jgi:hypothetical protein
MADRDSIITRIALEGAEDIKKALADVGSAAESAFKQIQDAAQAPVALGGISNFASTIRGGFESARASFAPIAGAFNELRQAGNDFGRGLQEVGDRVFPHFREVAALATGFAIDRMVELTKAAAEYAHQIETSANITGTTVQQFQGLALIAGKAGVDIDSMTTAFSRLNRSLGQGADKSEQVLADLGKDLIGNLTASGTAVLNGLGDQSKTARSKLIGDIQEISTAVLPVAQRLRAVLIDKFQIDPALAPSIQQLQQQLTQAAGSSAKVREQLLQLGAVTPAKTLGEAFDRLKESTSDLSVRLKSLGIDAFDPATGKARPLVQVLGDLVDWYERTGNASERARVLFELFGRQSLGVAKILAQGRAAVQGATADLEKLGIGLSLEDTEAGSKLVGSFNTLRFAILNTRTAFVGAFSPALSTLLEGFVQVIGRNKAGIVEFGQSISAQALPAVRDLVAAMNGASRDSLQTDFGKGIVDAFGQIRTAATFTFSALRAGFTLFATALAPVTAAINGVFGENFNKETVAALVLVLRMVGGFALVTEAINVAKKAAGLLFALFRSPTGLAITTIGLLGFYLLKDSELMEKLQGQFKTPFSNPFADAQKGAADTQRKVEGVGDAAKGLPTTFHGAVKQVGDDLATLDDQAGKTLKLIGDANKAAAAPAVNIFRGTRPPALGGASGGAPGLKALQDQLNEADKLKADAQKRLAEVSKDQTDQIAASDQKTQAAGKRQEEAAKSTSEQIVRIIDAGGEAFKAAFGIIPGQAKQAREAAEKETVSLSKGWEESGRSILTFTSQMLSFIGLTNDKIEEAQRRRIEGAKAEAAAIEEAAARIRAAREREADTGFSAAEPFGPPASAAEQFGPQPPLDLASPLAQAVNGVTAPPVIDLTAIGKAVTDAKALLQGFADYLTGSFDQAFRSAADAAGTAWAGFVQAISDGANSAIALLQSVADKAIAAATAVSNFLGSTTGNAGDATAAALFAGGGYVSGPGTATSDSIPAYLSDGEFVNRTAAVDFYGPGFFHALNNMAIPKDLVSRLRSIGRFAAGGLVGAFDGMRAAPLGFAGGGLASIPAIASGSASTARTHVNHFHLPTGETATMLSDEGAAQKVIRYSRSRQVRSAGRLPTWST